MKSRFAFTRLEMALLVSNALALGGCVVLLLLGRASGPLVLLTIGTAGMLIGNVGRAWCRANHAAPASSPSTGR